MPKGKPMNGVKRRTRKTYDRGRELSPDEIRTYLGEKKAATFSVLPKGRQVLCSGCNKLKVKLLAGKYGGTRYSKWVDIKGRHFNGSTCPKCHVETMIKRNATVRMDRAIQRDFRKAITKLTIANDGSEPSQKQKEVVFDEIRLRRVMELEAEIKRAKRRIDNTSVVDVEAIFRRANNEPIQEQEEDNDDNDDEQQAES